MAPTVSKVNFRKGGAQFAVLAGAIMQIANKAKNLMAADRAKQRRLHRESARPRLPGRQACPQCPVGRTLFAYRSRRYSPRGRICGSHRAVQLQMPLLRLLESSELSGCAVHRHVPPGAPEF